MKILILFSLWLICGCSAPTGPGTGTIYETVITKTDIMTGLNKVEEYKVKSDGDSIVASSDFIRDTSTRDGYCYNKDTTILSNGVLFIQKTSPESISIILVKIKKDTVVNNKLYTTFYDTLYTSMYYFKNNLYTGSLSIHPGQDTTVEKYVRKTKERTDIYLGSPNTIYKSSGYHYYLKKYYW